MSTFVTVGNCRQAFRRLLDPVAELAARGLLPAPVIVQHGYTPFNSPFCSGAAFLTRSEFDERLTAATLVISHGGVVVLKAVRAGKVPVVMARRAANAEHIDDHQLDFATLLAEASRIALAESPEELAAAVELALRLQAEPRRGEAPGIRPVLLDMVNQTLKSWETTRTAQR